MLDPVCDPDGDFAVAAQPDGAIGGRRSPMQKRPRQIGDPRERFFCFYRFFIP